MASRTSEITPKQSKVKPQGPCNPSLISELIANPETRKHKALMIDMLNRWMCLKKSLKRAKYKIHVSVEVDIGMIVSHTRQQVFCLLTFSKASLTSLVTVSSLSLSTITPVASIRASTRCSGSSMVCSNLAVPGRDDRRACIGVGKERGGERQCCVSCVSTKIHDMSVEAVCSTLEIYSSTISFSQN